MSETRMKKIEAEFQNRAQIKNDFKVNWDIHDERKVQPHPKIWWREDQHRIHVLRKVFREDSEVDDEDDYGNQIYQRDKDPKYLKLQNDFRNNFAQLAVDT